MCYFQLAYFYRVGRKTHAADDHPKDEALAAGGGLQLFDAVQHSAHARRATTTTKRAVAHAGALLVTGVVRERR